MGCLGRDCVRERWRTRGEGVWVMGEVLIVGEDLRGRVVNFTVFNGFSAVLLSFAKEIALSVSCSLIHS